MTDSTRSSLDSFRRRINDLDRSIHRDLQYRAAIVDELTNTKAIASHHGEVAMAYRPAREAEITRRLVIDHKGSMPLTAVDHVWRQIMAASVASQVRFTLALSSETSHQLRDLARYHFAFAAEIQSFGTANDALDHCRSHPECLALVGLGEPGHWWSSLESAGELVVLARLPFLVTNETDLGDPAYLVGAPTADIDDLDVAVYAIATDGDPGPAMEQLSGRISAQAGSSYLIEVPAFVEQGRLMEMLTEYGSGTPHATRIGAIAAPVYLLADGDEQAEPRT